MVRERNPVAKDPEWGSDEWKEAIRKHDEKADPKREEKGLNYTKSRNPKNPPKDNGKKGKGKK